ncbi:MAG: exopolyphosphatase, partial [Vampirovibrionales bacterium]
GLVCGVLLKHLSLIDDILFVHPKDMQDGKIVITENDITTNLPYVPGVGVAFDHHLSETIRNTDKKDNHIIIPSAPSAARVVWEYYGGHDTFPKSWDEMMVAVDKGDSAQFTVDEILTPEKWVLLNYLMDSRTGLGRFHNFTISNYQLMMKLIDLCKDHSIEYIMQDPDVQERVKLYFEHQEQFKAQVLRCATTYDNVIVLDLRDEEVIWSGNRFMIYALYPQCNVSIHCIWGLRKQNTVFATGKSIVNRSSQANIGEIMLSYGGGGHENAGTCQVPNESSQEHLLDIVHRLKDATVLAQPAS